MTMLTFTESVSPLPSVAVIVYSLPIPVAVSIGLPDIAPVVVLKSSPFSKTSPLKAYVTPARLPIFLGTQTDGVMVLLYSPVTLPSFISFGPSPSDTIV